MYQVEALRISQSRLAAGCGTAEPVHLAAYTSARQNTRRAWKELLKSQCSLATHRYLRREATGENQCRKTRPMIVSPSLMASRFAYGERSAFSSVHRFQ